MSLFKGEEENLKIKMAFHLRKDTSDIFSGKVADNGKDFGPNILEKKNCHYQCGTQSGCM